ncbi:hypothetical protein [Pedobacter antarcticus]|uniref:hypothetical protein n=1 Tax=Pedobacter antarcticus TaxID=34086 RepID=UPI001C5A5314|nr:hypothetical protein [Pedobacter antarcticus]
MKLEIKLTLVGLLCFSSLFGQQKASGYVYLDKNGNGKRDKQEPGLAGTLPCISPISKLSVR